MSWRLIQLTIIQFYLSNTKENGLSEAYCLQEKFDMGFGSKTDDWLLESHNNYVIMIDSNLKLRR